MLALFWMITIFHLYFVHWGRAAYWRQVHLTLGR